MIGGLTATFRIDDASSKMLKHLIVEGQQEASRGISKRGEEGVGWADARRQIDTRAGKELWVQVHGIK